MQEVGTIQTQSTVRPKSTTMTTSSRVSRTQFSHLPMMAQVLVVCPHSSIVQKRFWTKASKTMMCSGSKEVLPNLQVLTTPCNQRDKPALPVQRNLEYSKLLNASNLLTRGQLHTGQTTKQM